jgi:DNA-binding transcriptional ArsR family regulator
MPLPTTIEPPVREKVEVSLEPVRNAIASMMLVVMDHLTPSSGTWLGRIRESLSEEELAHHRLVIIGFFHALLPGQEWASFPEYLAALADSDATALRDKMLNAYELICMACDESILKEKVDWPTILQSVDKYVGFLIERFGTEFVEVDLETKAYEYVIDPPAMKQLIVEHLRWFWDNHLSKEWARMEPLLKASVKAFQNANLEHMSRLEATRCITGQDVDELTWREALEKSEQIIFVPNPHIGPYVTKIHFGKALGVIFGARHPEGTDVRIPELDRADIAARMSAIADETRLSILQMICERGEMRSQDIMEEIELSQPSVSRYLTQLSATGYLQERRVNGAKAYALNRDRIEKNLKAVKNFLLGS